MKRGMLLKTIVIIILFSGINPASDILFLYSSYCSGSTIKQLETASRFYDLDVIKMEFEDTYFTEDSLRGLIKSENIQAVVISAALLDLYEIQNTFLGNGQQDGIKIPVLIADITSGIDDPLLDLWSNGAIVECKSLNSSSSSYLSIGKKTQITEQLGGVFLSFKLDQIHELQLDGRYKSESLIKVSSSSRLQSVFVQTNYGNRDVFFLSRISAVNTGDKEKAKYRNNNFFQYAPWLMFLKYSCGQRCMIVKERFANFTIDDPWLIDPYGYFSYKGLLEQMKRVNFHTTIGFIPWNYDRSKKDVTDLIKNNPERFSISIHGNNHDTKEFNDFNKDFGDYSGPASVKDLEFSVKQAIARMEKFSKLTGIPYEKVMIFPHDAAPIKSLNILKKYNFTATANSFNVPPDSILTLDPLWRLRSVNNLYEDFPNFERYRAEEITPTDIAIDLFLGNPIMIYARHDFFQSGMERFNMIAREINWRQPDIKWGSPGEIARKYYMERQTEEEIAIIYSFSNEIVLKNSSERTISFNIIKHEHEFRSIERVLFENTPAAYSLSKSSNQIIIPVEILPGQSRQIHVEYKNNLNIAEVDISKNDWKINTARRISDYLDMNFSTNFAGQLITALYYESGLYQLGIKKGIMVVLMIISITVVVVRYLYVFLRREPVHPEHPGHQKA